MYTIVIFLNGDFFTIAKSSKKPKQETILEFITDSSSASNLDKVANTDAVIPEADYSWEDENGDEYSAIIKKNDEIREI